MKGTNMDTFDIMQKGKYHIGLGELGHTFDVLINDDLEEYFVIVENTVFIDQYSLDELFTKYYLQEILDLGNCYLGTANCPQTLLHLSKTSVPKIKVAIYYSEVHPYKDTFKSGSFPHLSDKYTESYLDYISHIEKWITTNKMPREKVRDWEFRNIAKKNFDYKKPYPHYYQNRFDNIRGLINKSQCYKLSDIADISFPVPANLTDSAAKGKVLNSKPMPSYPFYPERHCKDLPISTVELKKGDIIRYDTGFFLIDSTPKYKMFAPYGHAVIRARKFSPEFLYIYLNSDTAKEINQAIEISLGDNPTFRPNISDYPVYWDNLGLDHYKNLFEKIADPYQIDYEQEQLPKKESISKKTLQEAASLVARNSRNELKKICKSDFKELTICLQQKAYKATLVLAGAILEAFLLDWLSEYDQTNYFKKRKNYRPIQRENNIPQKDSDGNYLRSKADATLSDYIDDLKELNTNWNAEAKKADRIRKQRNLVHAKLYFRHANTINGSLCTSIVQDLKEIINSRWPNQSIV